MTKIKQNLKSRKISTDILTLSHVDNNLGITTLPTISIPQSYLIQRIP